MNATATHKYVTPRKVTDKGIAWDDPRLAGFRWIVSRLARGEDISGKVTIRHEGRCGRCGRKLTTPASIDTGIGPVCAERMGIPHGEGEAAPFDAWAFMLAGNATITATSERTGTRYTYRIRQATDAAGDPTGPYFVSVLFGPCNESDYRYIGLIFPED